MALVNPNIFGYRTEHKETHIVIICKDCQANLIYKFVDQPIIMVIQTLVEPDLIINYKTSQKEFGISEKQLEEIVDILVARCKISASEFVSLFMKRKFTPYVRGAFVTDGNGTKFWCNAKFETSFEGSYRLINLGILNLIFYHILPNSNKIHK